MSHEVVIAPCWPHSGKKFQVWIDGEFTHDTNDLGDALAERVRPFSNAEFHALPRLSNGDVEHLSQVFMWLTDGQKNKLTGDDKSRLDDYEEEVRIMMAEAAIEFGG